MNTKAPRTKQEFLQQLAKALHNKTRFKIGYIGKNQDLVIAAGKDLTATMVHNISQSELDIACQVLQIDPVLLAYSMPGPTDYYLFKPVRDGLKKVLAGSNN